MQQRLGRYELLERIASGGQGTVWRAQDTVLDRVVAIKVLNQPVADDPRYLEALQREARLAAGLLHPNITAVFDFQVEGEIAYIVMEYVADNLSNHLQNRQHIPYRRAVEIGIQICRGLSHAHENEVIHRDIKLQNILLTNQGDVKVSDFGIARALVSSTRSRGTSNLGTPYYMSPEQWNDKQIDGRADIYSLGILLYEMLTGSAPFQASSIQAIYVQHQNVPVPAFAEELRIPNAVEAVVRMALEKNPDNRFNSADAMENALQRSLNRDPSLAQPTPSQAHNVAPPPREPESEAPGVPPQTPPMWRPPTPGGGGFNPRWLIFGGAGAGVLVVFVIMIMTMSGGSGGDGEHNTRALPIPTSTSSPILAAISTPEPIFTPAFPATIEPIPEGKNSTTIPIAVTPKPTVMPAYMAFSTLTQLPTPKSPIIPKSTDTPVTTPTPIPIPGYKIAFIAKYDSNFGEVYVVNVDGSGFRRVTFDNAINGNIADMSPSWSPDGTKIAFSGRDHRDGLDGIYVVNADGSNQLRIKTTVPQSWVDWSKAGKLVFNSRAGFATINEDGDDVGPNFAISSHYPHAHMTWSPSGKEIASIEKRGGTPGNEAIVISGSHLLDSDGFNRAVLTEPGSLPFEDPLYLSFSPDGKQLAFSAMVKQTSNRELGPIRRIYVVDRSGSNIRLIGSSNLCPKTTECFSEHALAWSPNGTQIAFYAYGNENGVDVSGIYVMDADGSNRQRIYVEDTSNMHRQIDYTLGIDWSPFAVP